MVNNQPISGKGGAPYQPAPNSGSHPMLNVVNAMGRGSQEDKSSHPMIVAAHTQGNSLMSKVTNGGPMKSGSGITIGPNKPASGVGCGSKPNIPAPNPGSVIIGPNRNVVGPGGENPLARAANRVVNSLYGTGSLTANQVHVNSVQSNIRDTLAVADQFNNANLKAQLLNAQTLLTSAVNAKDSTVRAQALNNARLAMNAAHAELASLGYNGGKQPMGQVSTPNIGKLF